MLYNDVAELSARVVTAREELAVKYDAAKTSEQTLAAAIAKLGYEVHGIVEPGTVPQHHEHHHHHNHN